MKTLIELFDNDRLKNVLVPLMFRPENVIYICDVKSFDPRWKSIIIDIFEKRNMRTNIHFKCIDIHDFHTVETLLHDIKKEYGEFDVEITGGDDLLINCIGHFSEENRINQIYKDFSTGEIVYSDETDQMRREKMHLPRLSVEEAIKICGGEVTGKLHQFVAATDQKREKLFFDISKIFLKYKQDWAEFSSYLQGMDYSKGMLFAHSKRICKQNGEIIQCKRHILKDLVKAGAIKQFDENQQTGHFSFKFPNEQTKNYLTNQGACLENYVYYIAKHRCRFDDVQQSVEIEWTPEDNIKLRSEIDVLFVKRGTPVFVSCKTTINNKSHLALYEIKSLCETFGGGADKAVLVTSDDVSKKYPTLAYRAKVLGITLLDASIINDEQKLIAALNAI